MVYRLTKITLCDVKLEKLRSRVIQTTFSTPGVKAPNKQISDDELLAVLKKSIDERTDLVKKFQVRSVRNTFAS